MTVSMRVGQEVERDSSCAAHEIQYRRNDFDFDRGSFRVRGDVIEVFPVYEEHRVVRVEIFGDESRGSTRSIRSPASSIASFPS
jgi:excinuclease ABC subunit B